MAGFWRKCRITLRWLRFAVWLLVLLVLGAFLWFNRVGLPDFLKTRLVTALREQGVALEFSRMRLSLVRGLVADNVSVGQHGASDSPTFTARLVELELDFPALWDHRLALNGLILRDGLLTLPLAPTNALAFTNLQAELRFGTNDTWSLNRLGADFAGAKISIRGEVAHARAARDWEIFRSRTDTPRGDSTKALQDFSRVLRDIAFQGRPELRLEVSGDARDMHAIALQLAVSAPGVRTPWFSATNFSAAFALTSPTNAPDTMDPAWGFWTNLQPYRLAWSAQLGGLRMEKLALDRVDCAGLWAAPALIVSNASVQIGSGRASAAAQLDIANRRLEFKHQGSFDPRQLAAFLPAEIRTNLMEVSFGKNPALQIEGSLRVPPWTNPAADYNPALNVRGNLAVTNVAAHGVKLDRLRASFRYFDQLVELPELFVAQGRTELRLSGQESEATKNFRFRLDGKVDSEIARPFLKTTNAVNGFAYLAFREPVQLSLDVAGNLRRPESVSATGTVALANFAVRGQAIDRLTTGVTYSNLTAEFLQPHMERAGGAETFSADKLVLDLAGLRLFFVNGLGHVEPMAVGNAIGPKTAEAMAPYQFLAVPTARVNGCVPLKQVNGDLVLDDADMRFEVVGTAPFRWKKFETPAIGGLILWKKNLLIVTNAAAECYTGTATGWGTFDLKTPGPGTDFSFFVQGTNVDFHRMGTALWSPTNRLEGALAGELFVSQANSSDWRTWNGAGRAHLRDGLLWDVPMLAFMSPVLNTFSPGLGNSRATEAKGAFIMTNGVIASDSLVIEAQSMRLEYVGTVDLQEQVNARVTARLLRNMPVLGSVLSFVLTPVSKIFECRVTGTLSNPKVAPIYIPKILLVPLHPIRSLEELFSPSSDSPTGPSQP